MPSLFDILDDLVGRLVRTVRLNSVSCESIDGREVIVKRRNPFGRGILPAANVFFLATGAPIFFWTDPASWQRWESHVYRMLHPRNEIRADQDRVVQDRLPGKSLWTHLCEGTLTRRMVVAAAAEFRRGHAHWSDVHEDRWSHGDGAMCNVLWDENERRARLIDFELVHRLDMSADQRHAEDLLSFLLDLCSRARDADWLPLSLAFVSAYGDRCVIETLCEKLVVPSGLARVWWKVRTNFASTTRIRRRLESLREALEPAAEPRTAVVPLPMAMP